MRLINCTTMKLEEFFGDHIPPYTILSHTWGENEVTFTDFTSDRTEARKKEGYKKIDLICNQTLREQMDIYSPIHDDSTTHHGYEWPCLGLGRLNYAWVDSCCIDKTSSTELSEAINSMFMWYAKAEVCFAYLSDVSAFQFGSSFYQSRWFSRGWTLQELIAPSNLRFYDRDWIELGTRLKNVDLVTEITGIPKNIMDHETRAAEWRVSPWESLRRTLKTFPAAVKISWASKRSTTRDEDMSYCLLGLLDINMPLLYGEGKNAFMRLQKELINQMHDDSILAWGIDDSPDPLGDIPLEISARMRSPFAPHSPILAHSPHQFQSARDLWKAPRSFQRYTLTNLGLEMQIPLIKTSKSMAQSDDNVVGYPTGWIGLLSCSSHQGLGFVGIPLIEAAVEGKSDRLILRRTLTNDHGEYDQINMNSTSTLIMGPSAVVKAKMKDIIIIESEAFRRWDTTKQTHRPPRIVTVSGSLTLQDVRSSVVFGALALSERINVLAMNSIDLFDIEEDDPKRAGSLTWSGNWDAKSKILVLETHPLPPQTQSTELCVFHVQCSLHDKLSHQFFTVIIELGTLKISVLPRRVTPNTWYDLQHLFHTSESFSMGQTGYWDRWNLQVIFIKHIVHGREIFELKVDHR